MDDMVDGVWIPIIALLIVPVTAIGWPLARAAAKRMEQGAQHPRIPADVSARLERMEQAIDSIAVEVERISEGQRFTTKLLSERTSSVAPPGAPPPER
jgi:hypothetical protein